MRELAIHVPWVSSQDEMGRFIVNIHIWPIPGMSFLNTRTEWRICVCLCLLIYICIKTIGLTLCIISWVPDECTMVSECMFRSSRDNFTGRFRQRKQNIDQQQLCLSRPDKGESNAIFVHRHRFTIFFRHIHNYSSCIKHASTRVSLRITPHITQNCIYFS